MTATAFAVTVGACARPVKTGAGAFAGMPPGPGSVIEAAVVRPAASSQTMRITRPPESQPSGIAVFHALFTKSGAPYR